MWRTRLKTKRSRGEMVRARGTYKLFFIEPWWTMAKLESWGRGIGISLSINSVHFSSVTQSCPTLCNPMNCSTAGLPVNHQLPEFKLISTESVMPSSHLILCCPLLLLPPIPPSIRVFSNESTLCMRWPKYWSFSFSISPSNEHPGLISFRMNWLDLLAVQGTLKNLLQHHSSKASILRWSAFFAVQLSHPYHDHWSWESSNSVGLEECWQVCHFRSSSIA